MPSVPADTKLSKLDVLVLAADYIAHLTQTLQQEGVLAEDAAPSRPGGNLHPVKVNISDVVAVAKGDVCDCCYRDVVTVVNGDVVALAVGDVVPVAIVTW